MLKRLALALAVFATVASPALAGDALSTFQQSVDLNVSSNGQNKITGAGLNTTLKLIAPVIQRMGFFDSVGNFHAAVGNLPIFGGDTGQGGAMGLVPPPLPGDGAANKFLSARGGFTAVPDCLGDAGVGGVRGGVPKPPAGAAAAGWFLRADCSWAAPPASTGGANIASNYSLYTLRGGL